MGIEKRPWLILGTPFRCPDLPSAAKSDLDALLGGFPRAERPAGEVVEIGSEAVRGEIADSGAPLSAHVEYRLIDEAIRRARDRWVLHAGAVAAPGGTCLIVGESGAGKTSLTLWLWANGLRLVTDDLCPLVHGTLEPETFPRALHMDAEYSPRLLARIPPRPDPFPRDYYPFPRQEGTDPLPPVDRLIVLERGDRPEGELEPLPHSEAAHHLLRATIRPPGFDFGRAWEDMVRLASRCRSHRLRASTPEGAGDQALGLLDPA